VAWIIGLLLSSLLQAPAPLHPDFSGTWMWRSRTITRPLTISQTTSELVIEAMGLPQGAGEEAFWLNGRERVETYAHSGFSRKYATAGRWDGEAWVGTVKAYAAWAGNAVPTQPHTTMVRRLGLDAAGTTLTIVSSGHPPPAGFSAGETVDVLSRPR
jgi:hypothetical protein